MVSRMVKLFRKVKYTYCRSGHVGKSFEEDSQKLRQVTKWCLEGWSMHIAEVVM